MTAKVSHSIVTTALGDQAGRIAHEINSPLEIIDLLLSELQHHVKADLPQFQDLHKTIHRISVVIKDLRTIARDATQDPVQPINIHKLVEKTFSQCKEFYQDNQIALKINVTKDLMAECRATSISQILLNLFANAFEAAKNSSGKWVDVTSEKKKSYTEIKISDSSKGPSFTIQIPETK